MTSEYNGKESYRWLVLGCCTGICFYAMGLTYNMFSMFQPGIEQEIGMTKAQSAAIISLIGGMASIGSILGGRIYTKYGIRKWSAVFGLAMGMGYLALGFLNSVISIYFVMVIVGIAYGAGSMVSAFTIINRWFYKRKGFMTGLSSMGSGIATIICPFFINAMISGLGVRMAMVVHGCVIMTIVIITNMIIRDTPQEKGLLPYGADTPEMAEKTGVLFQEAKRTARYWMVISIGGCTAGFIMPILGQISMIVQDSGYSSAYGATALSLLGAAMLVGKPLYGIITDRWSIQFAHYLTDASMVITIVSGMMIEKGMVMIVIFALSSGFVAAVSSVGPGAWVSRIFGNMDYEKCYSFAAFAGFVCGGAFTLLSGFMRDMTGSYTMMYVIDMIFLLASAVIGYIAFKEKEQY